MTPVKIIRALVGFLGQVVQATIALVFGALLPWQAMAIGVNECRTACLLLCICGTATLMALLALHELGHLLAGLAIGLPFQRYTLGILRVVREDGRLRVRLNTEWFQPAAFVQFEAGGSADSPVRRGIMILGGPSSNLLVGIACLLAASWVNPGPPATMPADARVGWRNVALLYPGDWTTAYLNVAGLLSTALGGMNLIPARRGAWMTDGAQLVLFWQLRRLAHRIGYPLEAVWLIVAALGEICAKRLAGTPGMSAHVSAREFCDYLLQCRGAQSADILRGCNLKCSEDVGKVVFGLVNAGITCRQQSDFESDFQGLFVLEQGHARL